MDIRRINDTYAVSGQIQASDAATLKAEGYSTVICNRPDDEDPGQPSVAAIREAVEAEGMAFHHIPFGSTQPMTEADVEAMRRVLDGASRPVFAYCRSGTRSTNIYGAAVNA
ncbi:TIGR01244 family phosphatase [Mesorhizobium sp. NBSH29]|uniref:TIGR01244 family sulfur transferase n=1 Tax=Mesorhizobium sp. NBSH29 TaxID=2654249 RepID=UPI0018967CCA|nr:TIGR01244 family sulfur transferase [Mesorhizobium sp. NBSH29]QPC86898.1 TIGR01244 family phosphatase [Mesorhizobium sp. NBSH29]